MIFKEKGVIDNFSGSRSELESLLNFHLQLLKEDLLPWWMAHALDEECGGVFSCIQDDGKVISQNKYIWSQARALWTFSAAYNRIEKNASWLETAHTIWKFLESHGQTDSGRWVFLTDRKGKTIEGPESIQCDAFAMTGLKEYAVATENRKAEAKARMTAKAVLDCLSRPGSYSTMPYPLPEGMKTHKVAMQFSLAFKELADLSMEDDWHRISLNLTREVLEEFWRPEQKAVLEYLWLDGKEVEEPIGRYSSPGHAYETAWYQLENLRAHNCQDWKKTACEIIRHSFELGWDKEYGGLYLGVDIEGGKAYFDNSEKKIWWPFTEAFCALLMAYEETGDVQFLKDYKEIHNWAFSHFPSPHGEWTQRLNRKGEYSDVVIALPVKDPFHLPRGIIYSIETLRRLTNCGTVNEY